MRFPSFPNVERTAVLDFSVPTTWSAAGASTAVKMMLTRQAVFPLWADQTSSSQWAYGVSYGLKNQIAAAYTIDDSPTNDELAGARFTSLPASTTYVGCSAGALNGILPIAQDFSVGPKPFIWIPINSSVYFVGTTNGVVTAATSGSPLVGVQIWQAPGEVQDKTVTCSKNTVGTNMGDFWAGVDATALSSAQAGGFWLRVMDYRCNVPSNPFCIEVIVVNRGALVVTPSPTAQPTVTVPTAGVMAFLPFVSAPDYSVTSVPWNSTRVTACSLTMQNIGQVLNKSGTFLCGRVNPQQMNPWTCTRSEVSNLHPAEKRQLSAETGLYTYVAPSTDLADYWDYVIPVVNTFPPVPRAPATVRLDNTSYAHVIFFDDPVAASFSMAATWHVEFRTRSTLWPISVSTLKLEALHGALIELHRQGYFFSAPWADSSEGNQRQGRRTAACPPTQMVAIKAQSGARPPAPRGGQGKKKNRGGKRGPGKMPALVVEQRPKLRSGLTMFLEGKARKR